MRKVNIEVEAVVLVPVKVKLNLLVRADDDANLTRVLNGFAKGVQHSAKADVEDYTVEEATFDMADADPDDLVSVVSCHLADQPVVKLEKIISSVVTDSR